MLRRRGNGVYTLLSCFLNLNVQNLTQQMGFSLVCICWPTVTAMCLQAERAKSKVILVKEALSKLSKQQYSIEELTRKPLPEGVDPLRLEDYLSDQDFKVGFPGLSDHQRPGRSHWSWQKKRVSCLTHVVFWCLADTSRDESSWVQRPAKLEAEESEEKQGSLLKHRSACFLCFFYE